MSEDPALLRMFREGLDGHGLIATMLFPEELAGVHPNDVKKKRPDLRQIAKVVGFAMDYGGSAFTVSKNLGISKEEAQEYIDKYFAGFAGLSDWMQNQKIFARKCGYVLTILAHKRHTTGIHSSNGGVRGYYERISLNAPIQGTAADVICLAQLDIDNDAMLNVLDCQMLLQVHDELVFQIPIPVVNACMTRIQRRMANALPEPLLLPLPAAIDKGMTYAEAK
jgi:DNA polymerase-1